MNYGMTADRGVLGVSDAQPQPIQRPIPTPIRVPASPARVSPAGFGK